MTSVKILSCDTSTKTCSVAIHQDGILVTNLETYTQNSHAENLTLMFHEACKMAKLDIKEIDAFALAQGPGSYTGLRIGSASIKGLCFALDKPLIALSTLQIMAEGLLPLIQVGELVCPMIDARRMEVFCGVCDSEGKIVLAEQPMILDETSFSELLQNHKILFAGNGAEKCIGFINNSNARFLVDYHPLAKNMGTLALYKFKTQQFADIAYFEPEYLKEFYTTAKIVG
jgi:tRNA threonylcarbamoyladenosine biosynthesis protein TsaB